ncbi:MAG: hypothetical protein U9Q81_05755 [Pseudomonadota bacterium]|nr:hypothetical protein [Pseudomonadota bacterium]
MNVVVSIRNRKAIPVRALPFVTGWTLSPDVVATELAESTELSRLTKLRACHLNEYGDLVEMLPKEWDRIVADLKALSAKLEASGETGAPRYASWRERSIPCLPAGVFVWRDEFEEAFSRGYSRHRWAIPNEREGDRALTFSPLIPDALYEVVMEGLNMYLPHKPDYEFWDDYEEFTLEAAAYLCCDLEPENRRQGDPLPTPVVRMIEKLVRDGVPIDDSTRTIETRVTGEGLPVNRRIIGEKYVKRCDLETWAIRTGAHPPFLLRKDRASTSRDSAVGDDSQKNPFSLASETHVTVGSDPTPRLKNRRIRGRGSEELLDDGDPVPSLPKSDAISWPQCLAILQARWRACAEEASFWIANNRIRVFSLASHRGFHAQETFSFLDEPETSVYELLDRYKYDETEIKRFDPVQDPAPGPVERLSVVWKRSGWRTAHYNPSGRYLSFERAVEFLRALPDLAPTSREEAVSVIRREMGSEEIPAGRIMPLLPLGVGMSDAGRLADAWFPEGSILMLAMEQWGAEIDGWDAATRRTEGGVHSDADVDKSQRLPPVTLDAQESKSEAAELYFNKELSVTDRRLPIFKDALFEYARTHLLAQVKNAFRNCSKHQFSLEESFVLPLKVSRGGKGVESGKSALFSACRRLEQDLRQQNPEWPEEEPLLFATASTFDRSFWQRKEVKRLCITEPTSSHIR